MAGRGRGRGGRGAGGMYPHIKQRPFTLFPGDTKSQAKLDETGPDMKSSHEIGPDMKSLLKLDEIGPDMKSLLKRSSALLNYWKASPYLLEQDDPTDSKKMHIERYSDRKKTTFTRDSLSQILVFSEFPRELVHGTARQCQGRKKFRWNPEKEIKRLDFFEQLEKKNQGREDKGEKEKKEGEEEEEEENAEEEEEEDFDDDDYNQNEYFDDDEDDYNDVDEGDEGPTY